MKNTPSDCQKAILAALALIKENIEGEHPVTAAQAADIAKALLGYANLIDVLAASWQKAADEYSR
jgi:hypothetical protein